MDTPIYPVQFCPSCGQYCEAMAALRLESCDMNGAEVLVNVAVLVCEWCGTEIRDDPDDHMPTEDEIRL